MTIDTERKQALLALQEKLGVSFEDLALLDEALTHSSFINEETSFTGQDNERLEFLGDAILGFLVAEWLYEIYPQAREGELTSLRAFIVRTESLAEQGRQLGLGGYLRMGKGEAASGGRDREANLCAAFEALVGAIYLDQGIDVARQFVKSCLMRQISKQPLPPIKKDPKTRLQEYIQSTRHITPSYETVAEEGPDHAKTFTAIVRIGQEIWGKGKGPSKQAAQQAAAQAALERLGI